MEPAQNTLSECVCYTRTEMRFLYSFLYTCVFILALPYFLIAGLLRGKYLSTAWERFGNIQPYSEQTSIWIHAVSVGELLASKSLIAMLHSSFPDVPLFISTTTLTGQKLAQQMVPGRSFYFPFDWRFAVQRVLRRIKPGLVLVLETEIWPNFLWTAQKFHIPTVLINGRISDKSWARYLRIRKFIPLFSEAWMQTIQDAERMKSLGATSVQVMGNMKYDFRPPILPRDLSVKLQDWKSEDFLWIAGSTMAGEERIILEAFQAVKTEQGLKLLIAPRHPERFAEVSRLISSFGFRSGKRTDASWENAEVLLLDSIGELAGAYHFADLVLIGGTLTQDGGGHNPIEPAYHGKPILSGPYFKHFRSVFQDFQRKEAIVITENLQQGVRDLLLNATKRSAMGESARLLIEENAGATQKVVDVVERVLFQKSAGHSVAPVLVTQK